METTFGSLLADVPARSDDEVVTPLVGTPAIRIERIVSTGQASPPDFWYDQPWAEWVMVVAGAATVRFADAPEPCRLGPGDYLLIAPHRRHRVEWTDPATPTVWLAVHFAAEPA
jgi:cupin 2 domain-containing protein